MRGSSQAKAGHLRKRPFEGVCTCCISAITSVISASWLGIILAASAKANLTRLQATSWLLLASALSSCLQIWHIGSCETNSSSESSCAISVVQQCYENADDRLFLVAVLLHSCLPPVARNLFASRHAGTVAQFLRPVDGRTWPWQRHSAPPA